MTVTSSPFISITYTRNGFTRESVLTFFNLSFSDAEYYTCLAQNDLVTLTSSNSTPAQLIVNRKSSDNIIYKVSNNVSVIDDNTAVQVLLLL